MSEREGPKWSGEGQPVAAQVSERIRSILADAEDAAAALRHEAEQEAQARLREAETESLKVVEEARREAERFLADRIARVSALSDELLERGQTVVERLDEAEQVRSELASLVRALGETAARLANEVRAMPGPQAPEIALPPARREWAEPDPPATASPELTDSEAEPGRTLAPDLDLDLEPEPASEPEPEPEPVPEPEPEPEPEPVAEEPVEPTPLRPEPTLEPNVLQPAPVADEPAAEEFEDSVVDEPPPEPTAEELELIESVRAAERERERTGDDDDDEADEPEGDGGPEVVELRAADATDVPEAAEVAADAAESEIETDADHDPAGDGASAPADQALGARLVALQMAVAGGNRGEVEAHLRRAFELDQPGAILDDIFGSGTGADKRVAWPEAG